MECPNCHAENLDGATLCYSCQGDLTRAPRTAPEHSFLAASTVTPGTPGEGDRESRGRSHKAIWIVAVVAVAVAALFAAIVFASGSGGATGSSDSPVSPAGPLSVTQQARLFDSVGRDLDRSAQQYQAVLVAADAAAVDNKAAAKAWSAEWARRQSSYKSEVAAVQAFNAGQHATPATTIAIYKTVKTSVTDQKTGETKTVEKKVFDHYETVPGTAAQHKSLPPHPAKPKKLDAPDQQLAARLDAIAGQLKGLQHRLDDAGADAALAQTSADARLAIEALQTRLRAARAAIRSMVRRDQTKGEIVMATKLAPLSLAGIGDVVQAVRVDLRAAAAALGLPDKAIPWASR